MKASFVELFSQQRQPAAVTCCSALASSTLRMGVPVESKPEPHGSTGKDGHAGLGALLC